MYSWLQNNCPGFTKLRVLIIKNQMLVDSFYGNVVNHFYTLFLFSFRSFSCQWGTHMCTFLWVFCLYWFILFFPSWWRTWFFFFLSVCEQLWLLVSNSNEWCNQDNTVIQLNLVLKSIRFVSQLVWKNGWGVDLRANVFFSCLMYYNVNQSERLVLLMLI